jgi:large subunit ribosomal protein L25
MSELTVRCLPKFLPESITIDLSKMELETILHLSDITLPEGVTLLAFTHGHVEEHNLPVVSLHKPRVAVVEETPEDEAAGLAAAKAASNGKAPAKGGKAPAGKAPAAAAKAPAKKK